MPCAFRFNKGLRWLGQGGSSCLDPQWYGRLIIQEGVVFALKFAPCAGDRCKDR